MFKNVIFDWSGTISDDFALVYNAIMKSFDELGIKRLSLDECRREFVLPYMNFYKKYTTASKEVLDTLFVKYYDAGELPKPFAGAKELLLKLKAKNKQICVLTSHSKRFFSREMKTYGFERLIDDIRASAYDKREVIESLMILNKFYPKETCFVGDMEHDIETGKKVKIKTIAVTWGYQSRETLEKLRPDFIIDSFEQLDRVLIAGKLRKN